MEEIQHLLAKITNDNNEERQQAEECLKFFAQSNPFELCEILSNISLESPSFTQSRAAAIILSQLVFQIDSTLDKEKARLLYLRVFLHSSSIEIQNILLRKIQSYYIEMLYEDENPWTEIVAIFLEILQSERIQQAVDFFIAYFEFSNDENLGLFLFEQIDLLNPNTSLRISWFCLCCTLNLVFQQTPLLFESQPDFFYHIPIEHASQVMKYYFRVLHVRSEETQSSHLNVFSFFMKILLGDFDEIYKVMAVHYMKDLIHYKMSFCRILRSHSQRILLILIHNMNILQPDLLVEIGSFLEMACSYDAIDINEFPQNLSIEAQSILIQFFDEPWILSFAIQLLQSECEIIRENALKCLKIFKKHYWHLFKELSAHIVQALIHEIDAFHDLSAIECFNKFFLFLPKEEKGIYQDILFHLSKIYNEPLLYYCATQAVEANCGRNALSVIQYAFSIFIGDQDESMKGWFFQGISHLAPFVSYDVVHQLCFDVFPSLKHISRVVLSDDIVSLIYLIQSPQEKINFISEVISALLLLCPLEIPYFIAKTISIDESDKSYIYCQDSDPRFTIVFHTSDMKQIRTVLWRIANIIDLHDVFPFDMLEPVIDVACSYFNNVLYEHIRKNALQLIHFVSEHHKNQDIVVRKVKPFLLEAIKNEMDPVYWQTLSSCLQIFFFSYDNDIQSDIIHSLIDKILHHTEQERFRNVYSEELTLLCDDISSFMIHLFKSNPNHAIAIYQEKIEPHINEFFDESILSHIRLFYAIFILFKMNYLEDFTGCDEFLASLIVFLKKEGYDAETVLAMKVCKLLMKVFQTSYELYHFRDYFLNQVQDDNCSPAIIQALLKLSIVFPPSECLDILCTLIEKMKTLSSHFLQDIQKFFIKNFDALREKGIDNLSLINDFVSASSLSIDQLQDLIMRLTV